VGRLAVVQLAADPGVPERMAAWGSGPGPVTDPATAQLVPFGHATAEIELMAAGTVPDDHVTPEPTAPDRMTGPPVLLVPMETQTVPDGQTVCVNTATVLATVSFTMVGVAGAPE
jgi:hypothetical protein